MQKYKRYTHKNRKDCKNLMRNKKTVNPFRWSLSKSGERENKEKIIFALILVKFFKADKIKYVKIEESLWLQM